MKIDTAFKDRLVELAVHYLALHGVIADSGSAERDAERYIRTAIDEAEYDAEHGRGAAHRKFLQDCADEVATWPAWKRGGAGRSPEGETP